MSKFQQSLAIEKLIRPTLINLWLEELSFSNFTSIFNLQGTIWKIQLRSDITFTAQ